MPKPKSKINKSEIFQFLGKIQEANRGLPLQPPNSSVSRTSSRSSSTTSRRSSNSRHSNHIPVIKHECKSQSYRIRSASEDLSAYGFSQFSEPVQKYDISMRSIDDLNRSFSRNENHFGPMKHILQARHDNKKKNNTNNVSQIKQSQKNLFNAPSSSHQPFAFEDSQFQRIPMDMHNESTSETDPFQTSQPSQPSQLMQIPNPDQPKRRGRSIDVDAEKLRSLSLRGLGATRVRQAVVAQHMIEKDKKLINIDNESSLDEDCVPDSSKIIKTVQFRPIQTKSYVIKKWLRFHQLFPTWEFYSPLCLSNFYAWLVSPLDPPLSGGVPAAGKGYVQAVKVYMACETTRPMTMCKEDYHVVLRRIDAHRKACGISCDQANLIYSDDIEGAKLTAAEKEASIILILAGLRDKNCRVLGNLKYEQWHHDTWGNQTVLTTPMIQSTKKGVQGSTVIFTSGLKKGVKILKDGDPKRVADRIIHAINTRRIEQDPDNLLCSFHSFRRTFASIVMTHWWNTPEEQRLPLNDVFRNGNRQAGWMANQEILTVKQFNGTTMGRYAKGFMNNQLNSFPQHSQIHYIFLKPPTKSKSGI